MDEAQSQVGAVASKREFLFTAESKLQNLSRGLVEDASGAVVSIYVVVVLYHMRPEDSPTVQSLGAALQAAAGAGNLRVTTFLADNTPGLVEQRELPAGAKYKRYPDNPGLAVPYNEAIEEAEREGYSWLLTLDQDTHLPLNFFSEMAAWAERYASTSTIAAIVPRIYDRGVPLSPFRFVGGFLPQVVGARRSGILGRHASALNSASVLRVSALRQAGGYDPRFPLNNSDTALFTRLDKAGYRVAFAENVEVQHQLAIMSRSDRMTPGRYQQLLKDERDFWDLHMGALARAERMVRLMGRVVKGIRDSEEAAFRRCTLREIRTRLFSRRSTRVEAILRAALTEHAQQVSTATE